MLQSWRWFGPDDPVTLGHARQAGASGIVTALHHAYDGRAWSSEEIMSRRRMIEDEGLVWSVCESIPMHSSVKLRSGGWRGYVDAWKDSLANLGRAGVPVVCYNFMPVVDWTRTDLLYPAPGGGFALRFDMVDFAAYDIHVLRRRGAEAGYADDVARAARARFDGMEEATLSRLEGNVITGLPGGEGSHTRDGIRRRIEEFDGLTSDGMRENLIAFLREVVPVAEDVGVRLAIHPDKTHM